MLLLNLLLLCVSVVSAATSSGSWSNTYLSIVINLDDTTGTADVQVTGQRGATGWYAFGIGTGMVNSQMFFVMWTNSDGSSTISLRSPSAHVMPPPFSNQSLVTNLLQSSSSGSTSTFHFSIPESTSQYSLSAQSSSFIWAYSTQTPPDSSQSAIISRHLAAAPFTMPLNNPPTITSTSQITSKGTRTGTATATSTVVVNNGGSGSTPLSSYDVLAIIHGTLGFIAWALLAPTSVFLARFGRGLSKWVQLHLGIHVFGVFILTMIVFIIGYVNSNGINFVTPHQILGLVILIAMLLQICLGGIIHHFFDPDRTHRPIRNHVHRGFGVVLLILGFVQIPLGLGDYGAPKFLSIMYYCLLGVWAGVFIFLTWAFSEYRARKRVNVRQDKP